MEGIVEFPKVDLIIKNRKVYFKSMNGWYNFPEDVDKIPVLEGVYLLSETTSEDGIVYIGRADDLNERLSQHPDPNNPCLREKNISYFAYEVIDNSEDRERELISKYDPICNRTN